ncbi:pitrilysin family protein [Candidatus Kapabacteria bacterium]|nr:pitrilysin family protein [Candidatus Kapabacteria bacterium]
MNKLISLLILGVVLLASINISKAEGDKVFPYNYTVETLENGLKVYLIPMESGGLASYYTVVRTGSRDEVEKGRSGFAHFFEHMMFRGTKKYPQDVYDSISISIGADANAYTTDDYTCYHLNIAAEDLEIVMDMESERFQNLEYKEAPFKTEAGAVYGEYRKNIANPFMVIWEKLKETAFKDHTYSHTTMGYVEDIKNMPNLYDYSKGFYDKFYRPENCILVIAGDIDPKAVMPKVKEYYSAWEAGYQKPEIKPEPEQTEERTAETTFDGKTNPIMCIAYKAEAYSPTSKISMASQLLGQLAFGSNSDLYKNLYITEQKVTFLSPDFPMNRDPFLNQIWVQVKDANDLDYVKSEVLTTIEWYQNNLVDASKLNDLKKRMKYSFLMGLNTPDNVAGGLARFIAITGGIEGVEDEYKTLDSITAEDIQKAAMQMTENKRTVVKLFGTEG